jgi:dTDP-glucose 4,6-dehydratase
MKLLVTGGTGFIGSNFIRRVLTVRTDHEVTNLDKLTYAGNLENLADISEDSRLAGRYRFVRGDITRMRG